MDPKVSIIIPVYNVEAYLAKCLDSVINQTYENLEIICVNDGSTDGSLSVLELYAHNDTRIKIVNKSNGGLSDARNEGHKYVTGKYIMYLDSDDWIDLHTCESAVKKAEDENADVVFWNYVREFEHCSKPKHIFDKEEISFETPEQICALHRRFIGLYAEELKHPENADSIVTAWGKLYSSNIILDNRIEFVDTRIIGTEDALFNLYVFGYVNKAIYMSDCFNHYRKLNETSLTKTYKKALKTQWDALHEYMYRYVNENNCSETFSAALCNRICLSIIGLGMNILRGDSSVNKRKAVKEIISDKGYRTAAKQLTLKYFPIHWKVFFWLAKHNCASGVYFTLVCIKKLKGS